MTRCHIDIIDLSCPLRRINLGARAQAALSRRRIPDTQGSVRLFDSPADWRRADDDSPRGGTWVVLLHSSEPGWQDCVRDCLERQEEADTRLVLVSYSGRQPGSGSAPEVDGIVANKVSWWMHLDGVHSLRDLDDGETDVNRAVQKVADALPPIDSILNDVASGRTPILQAATPSEEPDRGTIPPEVRHDLVNAVGPLREAAEIACNSNRPIKNFHELWRNMEHRLLDKQHLLPEWISSFLQTKGAQWVADPEGPSFVSGEVQMLYFEMDRILRFANGLGRPRPDWSEFRSFLALDDGGGAPARLLWIDDEDSWSIALGDVFRDCGIELTFAQDPTPWLQSPEQILEFDAILLDMKLNGAGDDIAASLESLNISADESVTDATAGLGLLQLFNTIPHYPPIFILSARESPSLIRSCTRLGARGYLVKGRSDYVEFLVNLVREIRHRRKQLEKTRAPRNPKVMIGPADDPLHRIFDSLLRFGEKRHPATIILYGEPGVGKNEIAKELRLRCRPKGPFEELNCARFTSTETIESDLFGHIVGSFTGAIRNRKSVLELAHTGVLFIDEIDKGKDPRLIMNSLLNFIEERSFTRKGTNQTIFVDVLVVMGTNVDLFGPAAVDVFGKALVSRIKNKPSFLLPTLKERLPALKVLVDGLLRRICKKSDLPPLDVSQQAITWFQKKISDNTFAGEGGNIRGLHDLLENATYYLDEATTLQPTHLELAFGAGAAQALSVHDAAQFADIGQILANHIEQLGPTTLQDFEQNLRASLINALLAKYDRQHIQKMLRMSPAAFRTMLTRTRRSEFVIEGD